MVPVVLVDDRSQVASWKKANINLRPLVNIIQKPFRTGSNDSELTCTPHHGPISYIHIDDDAVCVCNRVTIVREILQCSMHLCMSFKWTVTVYVHHWKHHDSCMHYMRMEAYSPGTVNCSTECEKHASVAPIKCVCTSLSDLNCSFLRNEVVSDLCTV